MRDFAYLIDTYGHVPNGTRTYYLSRSQPPFFFAMVGLLFDRRSRAALTRNTCPNWNASMPTGCRARPACGRVARIGTWSRMPDGSILNRYWDDRDTPRDESYAQDMELARASRRRGAAVFRDIRAAAESGWDFSSRWFADRHDRATIDTTEIVPIDLNSLLFGLENAIRLGCERRSDASCARKFARARRMPGAAIDRYLWDASAALISTIAGPGASASPEFPRQRSVHL